MFILECSGLILPRNGISNLHDHRANRRRLLQVSADLGASAGQTLLNIIIPMSLPEIMAGVVFTLVPLMAAFIEPQMLGGGFVNLLGNSVNSALQELKYPTAAALSTVVVALLGLGLMGLVLTTRKKVNLSTIFQAIQK